MLKIKHATLEAVINPKGAELSSLKHIGSENSGLTNADSELIWQGDKNFWSGRAPILFPIVGALKDGKMTYLGQHFDMPRHGIARHASFQCIDHSDTQIVMSLKADTASRTVYPWDFELQVHFVLDNSGIEIRYTVFNHDKTDMLFTLGSHPAFALQLSNTYQFKDYAISFNEAENFAHYPLTEEGLLETKAVAFNAHGKAITLSDDIFNHDALVFRDINSTAISLTRDSKNLLTVETGGAPHLGIWSKPGAPFVCIEPWLGTSDFVDSNGEFASKPDLITLAPDQTFNHTIKICPATT